MPIAIRSGKRDYVLTEHAEGISFSNATKPLILPHNDGRPQHWEETMMERHNIGKSQ